MPNQSGTRLQVHAPPGFKKTEQQISPLIREKLKDLLDLENKNANMFGPEIMKLMDKNDQCHMSQEEKSFEERKDGF